MKKNHSVRFLAWVCLLGLGCAVGMTAQDSGAGNNLASQARTADGSAVPRLVKFSGTLKDLTGKPLAGPVE